MIIGKAQNECQGQGQGQKEKGILAFFWAFLGFQKGKIKFHNAF